jgi:hypothetical protein
VAGELRLAISVATAVMWREGYAPLGPYLSCVKEKTVGPPSGKNRFLPDCPAAPAHSVPSL